MRLGDLLVHTGVITTEQRDQALQQQVVFGARLGTNLIELGHATQDEVAHGLARLLHVPAALAHHFAHADPSLLQRVPRELAAHCGAYPIAMAETAAGRRLVVCLRNPTHPGTIESLRHAAGTPIIACVAPELTIFEWMERGYGVRRPERYRQAQPGRSQPLPVSDTGKFARVDEAGALEHELAVDVDMEIDEEEDMPAGLQLVELDHSDVARDFSAYHAPGKGRESALDLGPSAAAAVASTAAAVGAAPAVAPVAPVPPLAVTPLAVTPAPTAPAPLSAAAAIAAIQRATTRGEIGEAVVRFLRHRFAAGVMLIAKDGMALGHRGFGGSFDAGSVESILLPLNAPSMFRTSFEAARTCRGAPPSGGKEIHGRFFKLFPLPDTPAEVVVTPVVLRNRVVCLLYAHAADGGPLADDAVHELEHVARAVSDAYLTLIRAAKRS